MAHELVLLRAEVKDLRAANELLSKRWRAKKRRLQQGGSLNVQEAKDFVATKEAGKQINVKMYRGGRQTGGRELRARRYGTCGETGHNARTCQVDAEMSDVYSSEQF